MAIDNAKATAMWFNGSLDKEIAEEFGCKRCTVSNWRKKNGMSSNSGIFNWDKLGYVDPDKKGCKKYA